MIFLQRENLHAYVRSTVLMREIYADRADAQQGSGFQVVSKDRACFDIAIEHIYHDTSYRINCNKKKKSSIQIACHVMNVTSLLRPGATEAKRTPPQPPPVPAFRFNFASGAALRKFDEFHRIVLTRAINRRFHAELLSKLLAAVFKRRASFSDMQKSSDTENRSHDQPLQRLQSFTTELPCPLFCILYVLLSSSVVERASA